MRSDTSLNIRISERLKEKFLEIVEENDDTYSNVLRQFIKFYIAKKGKWRVGFDV